jgi:hypothetical protein
MTPPSARSTGFVTSRPVQISSCPYAQALSSLRMPACWTGRLRRRTTSRATCSSSPIRGFAWFAAGRFVEHDHVATAGGLSSGIDLALRVVERYLGADAADATAEHMEYERRPLTIA